MIEIIQQLLLTNNCVIIPNFGAIIANYQPAEIRLFEKKVVPPTKVLAFNKSLQTNDGVLVNAVMHKFEISYQEAEEKVADFSKECQHTLEANHSLILKEIGKIYFDAEKRVQFQPLPNKNFLLSSFGLIDLPISPIQRLKDDEAEIKEQYQRILHPELMQDAVAPRKKQSKVYYAMAAVLAVAFLTSTIGINIHKSDKLATSFSSIFPVSSSTIADFQGDLQPVKKEKVKKDIPKFVKVGDEVFPSAIKKEEEKIEPKKEAVVNTNAVNENPNLTKPEKAIIVSAKKKYKALIFISAFIDKAAAEKLKSNIEEQNYSCRIINENSRYKVTIEVNEEDVETSLETIKSEINPRAKVYCLRPGNI